MSDRKLSKYHTELFVVRIIRWTLVRLCGLSLLISIGLSILIPRLGSALSPEMTIGLIGAQWGMACLTGLFILVLLMSLLDTPVYKGEAETKE